MRHALLTCSVLALAACAQVERAETTANQQRTIAESLITGAQQKSYENDGVVISDEPYYGRTASTRRQGQYDPVLNARITVSTDPASPMTLAEAAQRIETLTGLPVRLDGFDRPNPRGAVPAAAVSPATGTSAISIPAVVSAALNSAPAAFAAPTEQRYGYRFTGTVREFVTLLASQHGVEWDVRGRNAKTLHIYRSQTKTWTIAAPTGDQTATVGFQNGAEGTDNGRSGSGGGGGGGSGPTSSQLKLDTTYTIKLWGSLKTSLEAMLAGRGTIAVSPDTWTVTVTAPPAAIDELDRWITELNDRLTRQIEVIVTVYTVNIRDSDDVDLKFNLALRNLGDDLRLLTTGPVTAIAAEAATATLSVNETSGVTRALEGSKLVAKALNTVGRTAVTYQKSFTTQSGVPYAFQNVTERGYAASVAPSNQSTNGTTQTAIPAVTPGNVSTGLKIYALPRALADGTVHMEMSVTDSRLIELRSIAQGQNTSIEFPQVQKGDDSVQRFFAVSGVPKVYTWFKADTAEVQKSNPDLIASLLSGFRSYGSNTQSIVVITTTAVIEPRQAGSAGIAGLAP